MSENNILHFEHIWENSEQIAQELRRSRQEIYTSIQKSVSEYTKLDQISSPEIAKTLKTKKVGEILFHLANLSDLDGINTFAALSMENELQKD